MEENNRRTKKKTTRSYFLSNGTDKAFSIIEALAELLTDIEHQPSDVILEQLKRACTQAQLPSLKEGDTLLYENKLYTALHKKRNFFSFFTPSSANAMSNLITPPEEKTLPDILASRFPFH